MLNILKRKKHPVKLKVRDGSGMTNYVTLYPGDRLDIAHTLHSTTERIKLDLHVPVAATVEYLR